MATVKKAKELDLFKDLLPAADMGIKELWDAASDQGKKDIKDSLWILNRWMSTAVSNNLEIELHYLIAVNECYNKNWFKIQSHPKLAWLSLCAAAHESKKRIKHEYIHLKLEKNKKMSVLLNLFPTMKIDDVYTLSTIVSEDEIKEYCKSLGWDKKQINELRL